MLVVIALVAFLGWSIAALSITALVLGVLPLLSTGTDNSAKDVEKPVDHGRVACSVCGSHAFRTIDLRD